MTSELVETRKAHELHPYEFFYRKYEDKFKGNKQSAKNDARNEYKLLDAEEKLKYIKLCEKAFDGLENPSKPLTELLTKDETQLLFESYGLPPKVVHKVFYNHYFAIMQAKYSDFNFGERAKLISDSYKNLSESEKNASLKKHKNVCLL